MNNDIRVLQVERPYPDMGLTASELGSYDCRAKDERLKEIFDSYKDDIRRRIVPKAAFGFGKGQGNEKLLFLVMTLGEPVLKYLDMPKISGDSYLAVVLNAMADSCLFVMEQKLAPFVRSVCKEKGVGISGRIRDSHENMLLACNAVDSERTLGVSTAGGYMKPHKSLFIGYVLEENSDVFNMEHDCSVCDAQNCLMRKGQDVISCPPKENVLEYLNRRKKYISSPCGGHGICGKCRIRVISGKLSKTAADRAFFTEKELDEGWRLACTAFPDEEIRIILPENNKAEDDMTVEGLAGSFAGSRDRDISDKAEVTAAVKPEKGRSFGAAIDIGTTTLAAAIADLETGTVIAEASCLNHQRSFGADVISRINAAVSGKEKELCESVNADIEELLKKLSEKSGVPFESIEEIMITGNSVMEHLLTGDDVSGFSKWPFKMAYSGWKALTRRELYMDSAADCTVTIAPGFSAFVGADIAAGMLACAADGNVLFIDVGTNGEMVLQKNGEYLAASTAAGPAFEGGCISCGTGSVMGAVSSVRIEDDEVRIETIQNAAPTGICGTGIIDAVSAMRTANIIDRTGKLEDRYRYSGYTLYEDDRTSIRITQDDIRSVQLAKGAIRAGIDTLLHRAKIGAQDIDKVILAGGFGCRIDPAAACNIGLLPKELSGKIVSMGNTSLKGALKLLTDEGSRERLMQLCSKAIVCELSDDDYFAERFIEEMNFE